MNDSFKHTPNTIILFIEATVQNNDLFSTSQKGLFSKFLCLFPQQCSRGGFTPPSLNSFFFVEEIFSTFLPAQPLIQDLFAIASSYTQFYVINFCSVYHRIQLLVLVKSSKCRTFFFSSFLYSDGQNNRTRNESRICSKEDLRHSVVQAARYLPHSTTPQNCCFLACSFPKSIF